MSRRYWSREPSSYEIFFLVVLAIEPGTPCCGGRGRVARMKATTACGKADLRSLHPFAESRPANPGEPGIAMCGIRSIAEVHEQRLAPNERVRHEAPVAAVGRIVPVVSENEVALLWDD